MHVAAGIDLGGTAVNYTFLNAEEQFLIEDLCEHPSRSKEGPAICLQQIEEGFAMALDRAGLTAGQVSVIGLDTPGPASNDGVFGAEGSTNFIHPDWSNFDIRGGLAQRLNKPVTYLNDGNAGALWGHFALFGASRKESSVSAIIGTGLGGGVIFEGQVVKGKLGFGGELGHVLLPYQSLPAVAATKPLCNCGRTGDLESLCSLTAITNTLLPTMLARYPDHELGKLGDMSRAAKRVRGLAEQGDAMCREIFQVQAQALGLFFDILIQSFDPDAVIVGGGAIETGPEFQQWFVSEIRAAMPHQRPEQASIPIHLMPNGDTAGARGAAVEALKLARASGLLA